MVRKQSGRGWKQLLPKSLGLIITFFQLPYNLLPLLVSACEKSSSILESFSLPSNTVPLNRAESGRHVWVWGPGEQFSYYLAVRPSRESHFTLLGLSVLISKMGTIMSEVGNIFYFSIILRKCMWNRDYDICSLFKMKEMLFIRVLSMHNYWKMV